MDVTIPTDRLTRGCSFITLFLLHRVLHSKGVSFVFRGSQLHFHATIRTETQGEKNNVALRYTKSADYYY